MMGNDRPKATSPAAAALRSAGTSCAAVATGAVSSEACEGALIFSNLLDFRPAKNAGRHEDQGDRQDHERRYILVVGGEVGRPEHFDEADQEAAQHRPGQRADAA